MSASVYERKSHLKKKLYSVERSRERCASNNLSHDNENLLVAAFFLLTISSFWERPYSREGNKLAVVLVT